jgi:3-hydroxypropanoate dehydrogenase
MSTDLLTESPAELALDPAAQRLLFTEARTANSFDPEPVGDETLRAIWELAKWPPTAANINPLRILYLRTEEAKQRLAPHMYDNNRAKTLTAPVVAVLAADVDFHEHIPQLFPSRPELKEAFADAEKRAAGAKYNATLQAGYFLLAVRAAGLAAGPMLGYDAAGVDAEFFADHTWESILVVNIGKPGVDPWFPRLPRLRYDQAVRLA